ncbi:helicase [Avibacterium gallinarum]|uniref:helicase n=1 Tax=Avibacterium TaxID=292486 RepID=UPI0039FBC8D1
MQVEFLEDHFQNISHQFAYFKVGKIDYIIDFSNDIDLLTNLTDNQEILSLINGKQTYTVKFAVKEYYESTQADIELYAAPKGQKFSRNLIKELKEQLESLLYYHYLQYQPDCYFFIAERPSLVRMYQKMCDNRHPILNEFQAITKLGHNQDCFIVKTPRYGAR